MEKKQTFTDVPTLRKLARQHIGEGAFTAGYAATASRSSLPSQSGPYSRLDFRGLSMP